MKIKDVEFKTVLQLEVLDGDTQWRVLRDFVALVTTDEKCYTVVVPQGFVTDLASVPRLPGMFWLFAGRARRAAVLHDYLYSKHEGERSLADAVFFAAMAHDQNWFTRFSMWLGVRVAGWAFWKDRPVPKVPDVPEVGVIESN